ncbi:P-loop containing nucleoside triphosphate hydrolase protein [Amylocarpus encephaloides]|uniref:P-loop containing nucleoside triphosphate hydrolase protein n=1 Tax=Amylocarpus encephaloides TaxID=45428 RepID=A0A9P7YST2_9HELO|nr:P-loop containing nucleoside triphosphate hydrolase protein [Amylocarpus encephaloides]
MASQEHLSSIDDARTSVKLDTFSTDVENDAGSDDLMNSSVQSFLWNRITVTVKDRETKQPKLLLDSIDGVVKAGEMVALMGPSGCGKTTLLNVLARRDAAAGAKVEGVTLVNGDNPSTSAFRNLSSFVEQDDALIGSLTIKETMHFAARFSHKNSLTKTERIRRINSLIESFGLRKQANQIVGTPIRKGISGGQKRRLSVISQLVTVPKILFLDEPTSGLDSSASFEVMSFIKEAAKKNHLIVIASIHQPSTTTFQLFDKLILLSGGKSSYFGPVTGVQDYFGTIGYNMPIYTNPAEFILELMNVDFSSNREESESRLSDIQRKWIESPEARTLATEIEAASKASLPLPNTKQSKRHFFTDVVTLVHRSFIKSYRDVVAYGIRIAMYLGLAIMMGTVWLRLDYDQASIQPVTNAIFFGGAFMSFMAVAYVPSYLEDRASFIKDRHNGLYGAPAFMVSNFIIGLPYLFFIAILFSSVAYWLSNFNPTGDAFMKWVMWLFLDLLSAESLVVLMSSIFPNFVVALALTAFANGLWMSVNGFMVPPTILNVFYKYVFSYIDYQSYVFKGMMVNQFAEVTYTCGSKCECMFRTPLVAECKIAGQGVLDQYGYHTGLNGTWVGILLGIVLGYRLLGLAILMVKKN